MSNKELEHIVEENINRRDIRLGRIALTTIGYGLIGALFDDAIVIAPMTAAVGLGLSLYDEIKQTGMKLRYPAAGIFFGGIIGSLFDLNQNEYVPNILAYGGAVLGGVLGIYKSFINRNSIG